MYLFDHEKDLNGNDILLYPCYKLPENSKALDQHLTSISPRKVLQLMMVQTTKTTKNEV